MFVNPETKQVVPGGTRDVSVPAHASVVNQDLGQIAPSPPPAGERISEVGQIPFSPWKLLGIAVGIGAVWWGYRLWRDRS